MWREWRWKEVLSLEVGYTTRKQAITDGFTNGFPTDFVISDGLPTDSDLSAKCSSLIFTDGF